MARTAPVTSNSTPEVYSQEQPVRRLADLGDDVTLDSLQSEIVIAQDNMAFQDYAAELAFNEDILTIIVARGREKHAPTMHDPKVNGVPFWIRCDVPQNVPRKYVEVLLRSQPMDVQTRVDDGPDGQPINRIERSQAGAFALTIIKDPSPKGRDWMAKVMREN